jgi:hypothetical protein
MTSVHLSVPYDTGRLKQIRNRQLASTAKFMRSARSMGRHCRASGACPIPSPAAIRTKSTKLFCLIRSERFATRTAGGMPVQRNHCRDRGQSRTTDPPAIRTIGPARSPKSFGRGMSWSRRFDELPTAAVPELFNVSMPPLPGAACDEKENGDSKGDDKNGNHIVHGNLPCCRKLPDGHVSKPGSQCNNYLQPMAFRLAPAREAGQCF